MNKCNHKRKNFYSKYFLALSVFIASHQVVAQDEKVLEEVMVTAEHREASVQDTQISVTALSSQTIKDLGISSSADLGHVAPNVVINSFQGGKSGVGINMRGMAQNETLVAFDPAIGVYVDNVLLSKNVGALLDIVDMERIEILRGPQGTLYGRNTMGGTVNFHTIKPTDEFEAKLVGTVGKYDQKDLKGMVNIPLLNDVGGAGKLNLRISGATITRGGLTDNNYRGARTYDPPLSYDTDLYGTGGDDDDRLRKVNRELDTKNRKAMLAHLQWEPSDDLTVLYSYDMTRVDEVPGVPWTTNVNPATIAGGHLVDDAIGVGKDRPDSISVDGPNLAETDVDGHSLHIDYALSDALNLVSITAYREMENFSTSDSDGSEHAIIQTIDTNINDQFTQEFRLVGAAMDARLDYTVGVFYMDEKGRVDSRVDALFIEGPPLGSPERNVASFENETWAIYGQATYSITDQLKFTAGIRYTEEDREMSKVWYPSALSKLGFINPMFPKPDMIDFGTGKEKFENVSPMASISYFWSDDLMTYFKISTGFQSGGFNVRDTNVIQSGGQVVQQTFLDGFDEEKLIAYELGMKGDFYDRFRVNTAVWFSDYEDKRVNNFNPETLGNTVRNAGTVEIYGMELEALAQLNDNFQVGFNYGLQRAEYIEYEDESTGEDLSNSTSFPYTPENSAGVFVAYEQPLPFALLKARLDWAFRDDYTFLGPQPERNSQQAYEIWNARITLDEIAGPDDTTIRVSLWGKNLTDEGYYYNGVNIFDTFGFDINLYAEPRTYGMDLEILF